LARNSNSPLTESIKLQIIFIGLHFVFVLPQTRRASIGDSAFDVAGPRAWNTLPPAVRSTSKSYSSFKTNLNRFWEIPILVVTT